MDITAVLRTPIILLALLLTLSGCFSSKPAGPTPEEQKRQAETEELQRLRDAERTRIAQEEAARKLEEEKRQEEERRKRETALPPGFGQPVPPAAAGQPSAPGQAAAAAAQAPAAGQSQGGATPAAPPMIAGAPATGTEQPTVPYDQAFPPIPDRVVRIAVVSAPSQANVAERIGVMLTQTERDNLERSLGMGMRIAFLSQSERDPKRETRIQYREKFLQAAVRLAGVIPQPQRVERMSDDEANRRGVDILIQVGSDLH